MIEAPKSAYPLTWPQGRGRSTSRRWGAFKNRGLALIRDEMLAELSRLGAREVIVSTNMRTRADGLLSADAPEPRDPGVAVYFKRRSKPYVLACDSYDKVWKNLRAIHATVEALRAIERHGSSEMLEQAFTGFAALPAHAAEPSWWDVLGVSPGASLGQIKDARDALAERHHPDKGGAHEEMARINRAYETACEERA